MRKRNRYLLSVILILSLSIVSAPVWAKQPGRTNTPTYYLSLGTSLSAGVQADPATGESIVTEISYPNNIENFLSVEIRKLRHVNLGCPGETSDTFIDGGVCDYPHGSQLDEAINFLHAHGKFTGLITIDLGANDALNCVEGSNIDIDCFFGTVQRLSNNLADVIGILQEVAGPNVPIVGMDYFNPLLALWFHDPTLAMQSAAIQAHLNGALLGVYTGYGIPVANISGVFMSNDFTDRDGGGIPDNVELICAWTSMCAMGNIHPNSAGYDAIANEFINILPPITIYKIVRHKNP